MGLSVKGISRIIPCYSEDEVYIGLPRGKRDYVLDLLRDHGIAVDYEDIRNSGRLIDVEFTAQLYPEQQQAADAMLKHDIGILQAATAFGKTAVGAYLIAARKVNTLILLHNREILKNWVEDLHRFLKLDEALPEYTTPLGRKRNRKGHIGRLFAAHNSVGGIIDVAMITSLGNDDEINPLVRQYGMVIMDECHHGAAYQANCVLNCINAKYVYGLTATPKRDDGMEQKVLMAFGPVRYRYTARQRAESQNVQHFVYPRFTRFCSLSENEKIQTLYQRVISDSVRNDLIIQDVLSAVSDGRTPLVLTKFKSHAQHILDALKGKVPHVFLLQGGRKNKERDEVRRCLLSTPPDEPVVVVAIGQYIGEGFNFPRLDTLMLTVPIAWEGNVEQYAGRLHRTYADKKDVVIYDYVDIRERVFDRMYGKRLRIYKRMGYSVYSPGVLFESMSNNRSFYAGETYELPLERDILNATEEIVISSTILNSKGVQWLLDVLSARADKALSVTILTLDAAAFPEREEALRRLMGLLHASGVKVLSLKELHERFVIIDNHIVWYGNANFLSQRKDGDNVLRMDNAEAAADILCAIKNKIQQVVAS
ncbi:MAG: DEAD/DEAH box helicase family protein [Akkermansia sp.]|nr:DEAD/DEAH box helicase family protein [Akkermansia sp.]